mgnify:CR=1 FL=1
MIDRKELAEELILRENVRMAIQHVLRAKKQRVLKEDIELRSIIRDLLEGQSAVAAVAKHDSTGINSLEDLLKNTNVLSTVETGYKSLTTRSEDDPPEGQTKQRRSYENHILSAVAKSLAPEESRKEAGEDVEISEEIDIDVGDGPEDDPDFIDVADEEVVETDPKEEFGLNGEDKTGRNKAFTDFTDIEKVILTAFDDLDNPNDMSMFEEYLIKNLVLYFEKYENELAEDPERPAAAADATPDAPVEDPSTSDELTDVPEFALEEGEAVDFNSLIEKLLEL